MIPNKSLPEPRQHDAFHQFLRVNRCETIEKCT